MNGSGRNGERRESACEGETGQLMARGEEGEEGIMRRTKSTGIIRAQILPQEARGRAEKDRVRKRTRLFLGNFIINGRRGQKANGGL